MLYSGVRCEPKHLYGGRHATAPGARDCAVGMYRTCRYAGAVRSWWSVLQHSLACQEYASTIGGTRLQQLYCLMHDMHEAVTSDVPSPWKTDDLRELQAQLDQRIHEQYNIPWPPSPVDAAFVHKADLQMLYAESLEFGPMGINAYIQEIPEDYAIDAVKYIEKETAGDDPRRIDGARAIQMFGEILATLLATWDND
jgi:hypothetical protein